ncbi:hypothetical protein ACFO7V_07110 [Glutamicibacter bergerei]|uniref:Ribbon-helix-helix protein CopG domain-containing protein n=2 Tax=Micrococcaceae TaxID=1268 RepID=A0ABV9ML84_9MICC|nr:hypothetical protein [Glutamicibacter sp. BW80]PCC29573.1 hypothetical protein CIK76_05715 [Glutamicibacter sp. BW80]HBV10434.1 hypothetical protein [Micrococcaceae bacterium]
MKKEEDRGDRTNRGISAEASRFEELALWAETAELSPNARITKAKQPGAGMDLLAAALGSEEAVRRAVGKPSMSGTGTSPARSVRLPLDLEKKLIEKATHDHVKPSEIIRRALGEYLLHAS